MSFEEEFPNLKGQNGEEGYFSEEVVQTNCLDKGRVTNAYYSLLKTAKDKRLLLNSDDLLQFGKELGL